MEVYNTNNICTGNPETNKHYIHEGNSLMGGGMQDVESTIEVLTRSDLHLAYSSEKLINLDILLTHLLSGDNDFEVVAVENSYISATSVQKALILNLLSGILESEVSEVENFVDNIQADIVDARHKIFSCRNSIELFTMMEEKLHHSEDSLEKTLNRVAELKMQSVNLHKTFSFSRPENWKDDKSVELSANGKLWNVDIKLKRQTAEQQRQILNMLKSSLSRELDLEKKLSELRQNEEQLKLKLHYTEQVAFRMEEAAEVVWGRFLEAENAAEVLMGISKELAGRLQVVQFNLNGPLQREAGFKSELQNCLRQLDAKDTALKKLESSIAEHTKKSSELPILMGKVNSLGEQLKRSELLLKRANDFNEESQEQLSEMEAIVMSLKESIYEAESRAETAETKVSQLTDTNLELIEEINFLKSNGDSSTKKVSLLEKQVRELEIQVQHSKASSEANQEQQNMLYAAIWDMETLIEDLKSKVVKAESKTEIVEEQCIILSETNMELDKEISLLKSKIKSMEASLDQANNSKTASAKEINMRTKLLMETVLQLAGERNRIQNQLQSLTKEKVLMEKMRNTKSVVPINVCKLGDDKKVLASENDTSNETYKKASEEVTSLSKCSQVDEGPRDASRHEMKSGSSQSTHESAERVSKTEPERTAQAARANLSFDLKAILVAFVAVIVIYLLHKKPVLFGNFR